MYEKLARQYDSLYTAGEDVFGNGFPLKILEKVKDYVSGGTVLDIGAGEGRNALYLATQGYQVTAIDLSVAGLDRLQGTTKLKNIIIKTKVSDVVSEGIVSEYDVIVLSFILFHLSAEDAVSVIRDAQRQTNLNGLNVIATFLDQGGLADRNKKSGRFYPDEETICDLYGKGWEVLDVEIEDIETLARDKQGKSMKNKAIFMIARKK